MTDKTLFTIAAVGGLLVVLILIRGIAAFARGGQDARLNSNRMMRWRLIAQAAVVLLVALYVWFRGN
ncbi:MAG: twin transmembrane helix small protein [Paracoccus sp. (in: a-proteobacteria)]|uniref:twin transmembrane helix small protein n=1 Tax=Paracoccus sp. TaxID=267 RepID=UPI0026E0D811|nr:twin transmembrane helix small protein [Paracoccus sp. (in: a-proteobacteria)]MDO5620682.1 twin transmembrane helix small protein [Paracoccus sp. (in: a-proteobacteria)]